MAHQFVSLLNNAGANIGPTQVAALPNMQQLTRQADPNQPITEEYVHMWISQLEQWTNVFYNAPTPANTALWQEAQSKLLHFQKIQNPLGLCMEIIKKTRNALVLYQATLCLKNAVANDFKKFDLDDLFKLFQFLYEFLCSQALENDMSVNETTALICAMILKRVASERKRVSSSVATVAINQRQPSSNNPPQQTSDDETSQITQIITTLCSNVRNPHENLSKKVASALMLNLLLLECQLSNRSTMLGLRIWKHFSARRLIELELKQILESCLETINWVFNSNLLNPVNQNRETQILFHLVGTLIQCVEYSLSFNAIEIGCSTGGERVLRVIQSRAINMLSVTLEPDKTNFSREWDKLVMAPSVVQFLFNLYTTVKSWINCVPGWEWPANVLKSCLNCLYDLSDVQSCQINSDLPSYTEMYAEFVGQLMLGAVRIMDAETKGVDDSFQMASLITSIAMHTSETRDIITKIKAEHFIPFVDAAQRFTTRFFIQVASTTNTDEEDEEEKTVDALLDFWCQLLRNIDSEITVRGSSSVERPKIDSEGLKAYSRTIAESYISCHLHKPLGQLTPRNDGDVRDVDLDQADEQDDNCLHGQQLISFGLIARYDALHTAKLLLKLISTRVGHLESLLTQYINVKPSPDGLKDWEFINDDLHWLLLMLQHYLTQTGYGEIGFMCTEITSASMNYKADAQKTIQGFEKCDYSSPEMDPIVSLVLVSLKLAQLEMGICQSGKIDWLSCQTSSTLTSFLSRFCLIYLYPKETDYTEISPCMNHCFGQDSPSADKFLRFVIERTCCVVMCMKSDDQIVKKSVQLLIQLITVHQNTRTIFKNSEEGSMTRTFLSQMRPDNLTGFSSQVAKTLIKLVTRLFGDEEDQQKLIDFFTNKWSFIMSAIENRQHQSEMVSQKLLEFCDFAVGVCEACDNDESSERLLDQLLNPITKSLPTVLQAFADFENIPVAVFDLLYHIVKQLLVHISLWHSAARDFYAACAPIIETYANIATARKNRGTDEEDCADIIAVLNFCSEVMKRDWGTPDSMCDSVVKLAIEKLSGIIKPDHMQFPRIRALYYRLLVYLVDDDDRLTSLNDALLRTIVSSILLAIQSQFDKDVDNHVYTVISIVCRAIYHEKDTHIGARLSAFMQPILPALFQATVSQSSFTINAETAGLIAPALFSLRCCYLEIYEQLVKQLIERQDDPVVANKIKSLFEGLESKIRGFGLNRSTCREFNTLFVPFIAELHYYVAIR